MAAPSTRRFGPPRFGLWAFFWAVVQPLRAVWWQLRFTELRALAIVPAAVTVVIGTALVMASVLLAAPAQNLLMTHGQGVLGNAAWVLVRILVHVVLGFAAVVATIRLQAAVAGAALERMALFVQRRILGTAPEPSIGLGRMVANALRALLPSLRSLVLWGLTALAAATVVLIPVVGPALVLPVEAALAAGFLAHGAVIDSRERMGLPRWLYLKEPACLLGLTLGFVPFVLFPPLMIVGGGTTAVAGALVATGLAQRRRAAAESGPLPPGSKALEAEAARMRKSPAVFGATLGLLIAACPQVHENTLGGSMMCTGLTPLQCCDKSYRANPLWQGQVVGPKTTCVPGKKRPAATPAPLGTWLTTNGIRMLQCDPTGLIQVATQGGHVGVLIGNTVRYRYVCSPRRCEPRVGTIEVTLPPFEPCAARATDAGALQ